MDVHNAKNSGVDGYTNMSQKGNKKNQPHQIKLKKRLRVPTSYHWLTHLVRFQIVNLIIILTGIRSLK